MEYVHYKKISLSAGELFVTKEPYMISTVLGSCMTTCIWDRDHRVGGMNHFVLPEDTYGQEPSTKYGDKAVKGLFEKMLGIGCRRENLRARVFSGVRAAKTPPDISGIDSRNMKMAIRCLADEGVSLIGGDGNGGFACRLTFNTYYGSIIVEDIYNSH